MVLLVLCFIPALTGAEQDGNLEYKINKNDLLEISVYDEPDLSKIVRVSAEGAITFPLLGEISVFGLSTKELEGKLTQALERDYLVNPQVNVFIKEYSKISVFGQVKNPGSYELKSGITVLDAIALAGGFTENADHAKVRLVRRDADGKRQTLILDTDELSSEPNKEQDRTLRPDDAITVPELGMISVVGQVKSPGRFTLRYGMTVIEAIALAGGLTDIAAPNGTKVIRTEEGQKMVFNIPVASILKGSDKSKDITLKTGDTVVVPESFF